MHQFSGKIRKIHTEERVFEILINLEEIDGITILKDKDYNLKLEVDLTKKTISDAIKLLDPDKIIDINISNTPLETIISSIYKGTK